MNSFSFHVSLSHPNAFTAICSFSSAGCSKQMRSVIEIRIGNILFVKENSRVIMIYELINLLNNVRRSSISTSVTVIRYGIVCAMLGRVFIFVVSQINI